LDWSIRSAIGRRGKIAKKDWAVFCSELSDMAKALDGESIPRLTGVRVAQASVPSPFLP
jgi:hypothetical protein